ncbi:hypothetical protein NL676_024609 [Syzygium grande]|nr:hypothetical protein NL676_024609 [Syzygium grande]
MTQSRYDSVEDARVDPQSNVNVPMRARYRQEPCSLHKRNCRQLLKSLRKQFLGVGVFRAAQFGGGNRGVML